MAHIASRRTKSGTSYDVRWRSSDGKEHRRAHRTWTAADNERKRIEHDELAGLSFDPRSGDDPFELYAKAWLDTRIVKGKPLRPSTRQGYEGLLRRNFETLRLRRLRQISPEVVRTWHAEVTEAKGHDQAAKSYRLLRAIMSTAYSDEKIARNPCRIRGGGTEDAAERPLLSTHTVMRLVEAIDERYRALLVLSGLGSLRTGEILGLTRADIDLLHGQVAVVRQAQEVAGHGRIVVEPKSDAGRRTVHLPPSAMRVIADHLDRFAQPGPHGVVFTGPEGTPLRRATLSKAWRAACVAVGVPDGLRIHDLRHHAATLTARTPGVTTKELMARIGHSTPRAALIYQHAAEERDRRVADYLEEQMLAAEQETSSVVPMRQSRGIGAGS